MDLVGELHKVETDGKPHLLYHNVKYPLPQIDSTNSSGKAATGSGENLLLQPLFVCPTVRVESASQTATATYVFLYKYGEPICELFSKIETSPLFDDTSKDHHHVLPLFWCNNKEADPYDECHACRVQTLGTDYYFCVECDKRYHKECVESTLEINYPSHVKHSLQLYFSQTSSDHCICCRQVAHGMVYYCDLCKIYMHVLCAKATIPFFIDKPKRHDHILTLFPRQASLTCNICGLIDKLHLTYVCRSICDFVAHSDCIYIPQTIRISRHHHRISFIYSLPFEDGSCGVCRRKIDSDYGAYTCNLCSGYVVHTRCALRNDIWDEQELEGVPEEDKNVEPFERIVDGIILHFSHDHCLSFESSRVYDESKYCQACAIPIYEEYFYVCMEECNFVLHETCANAPRKMIHPLHPHTLKLEAVTEKGSFRCSLCIRISSGFVYGCTKRDCDYQLDVRCGLASEPFEYQGHQHPLFLALDPKENPMCHVCKSTDDLKVLNCIECDFVICFKCATLPYMVRYKHDEHYLTFCHGDEASDSDCCELCEGKLAIGGKEGFYKCNDCSTTIHINCLLWDEPYLKPGPTSIQFREDTYIFRNNSPSRPICLFCGSRCMYPMFLEVGGFIICCSLECFGMKLLLL